MGQSVLLYALPAVLSTSMIVGCALPGPRQAIVSHSYMLDGGGSRDEGHDRVSKSCLTIRVGTPGSAPGFRTSRMAYVNAPPRLDYFAHHAWVGSPARMLETLLVTRLDRAGMFGAVLSGTTEIRTELRLDSELQRLVQIFDGSSSSVSLDIKVNLIDTAKRAIVRSQTFSYIEPAAAENPVAGVAAANRAANRFVEDLLDFLAESIDPYGCPP